MDSRNTTVAEVAALPRLLAGIGDLPVIALASHLDLYGALPDLRRWRPEQIVELVEQAGLAVVAAHHFRWRQRCAPSPRAADRRSW